MTNPGQQALTPALLRTLMQEAAAVPGVHPSPSDDDAAKLGSAAAGTAPAGGKSARAANTPGAAGQRGRLGSSPETPRERSAVPRIHWADGSFPALASGMPNPQGAA